MPLTRIHSEQLTQSLKTDIEDSKNALADADISAIATLSNSATGYLRKIGPNSWTLDTPAELVQSVCGRTGNITLTATDITSALTFTPYNASNPSGYLTSVPAQTFSSLTGKPTTLSGYGITDAQSLNAKLTAYSAFGTAGMIVWTSTAGAMAARTITAGTGVTVTNGSGAAGNPTIALTAAGAAGTYKSVTTNAYGQVTAGTNPTTLAGYGITDAYTKTEVDTALSGKQASLGFTPYNATNPSGFQTASDVSSAIQSVVGAAPAALDTLTELAAALGNDANYASTITTALSNKSDKTTTYTKTEVDTALSGKQASLGFTPYNATNPNGYITSASIPVQSVNGNTGAVIVSPATIGAINTNQLAIANGVATLGSDGKLVATQVPALTANTVEAALVNTGALIQTISAVVSATTGTATITLANTTPVSTAGAQIWSATITPNATTSHVQVSGTFTFVSGTASRILIAHVFRGTTCIGTFGIASTATVTPYNLKIDVVDSPNTTSATTYSIRVGTTAAATWYINQFATAYFNGTMALSTVSLHELA